MFTSLLAIAAARVLELDVVLVCRTSFGRCCSVKLLMCYEVGCEFLRNLFGKRLGAPWDIRLPGSSLKSTPSQSWRYQAPAFMVISVKGFWDLCVFMYLREMSC